MAITSLLWEDPLKQGSRKRSWGPLGDTGIQLGPCGVSHKHGRDPFHPETG